MHCLWCFTGINDGFTRGLKINIAQTIGKGDLMGYLCKMEILSEYPCMITKPNQMAVIKLSTYEPKYTPPTRKEMILGVLSTIGEYVLLGFLQLLSIACLAVGAGLLLSILT